MCDILRPAAERLISARMDRARHAGDFWAVGAQRRGLNRAAAAARAAAREEEDRLLRSLPCPPRKSTEWLEDLLMDLIAGFAGPEIRERVADVVADIDRRVPLWRERTQGIILPEELEVIRRDRENLRARLAGVMSPSQLEELELRTYYFRNFLFGGSERLNELQLTAAEFREFCRINSATDPDRIGPLAEFNDLVEDRPRPGSEADTEVALRALLGDARYEAYVRNDDPFYRNTAQLADEFKQPPEMIAQAYALMSQWRAEVPALQAQWAEDREAARGTLLERRATYRQRLEQILAGLPEDRRRSLAEKWTDHVVHEKWRQP